MEFRKHFNNTKQFSISRNRSKKNTIACILICTSKIQKISGKSTFIVEIFSTALNKLATQRTWKTAIFASI